MKMVIGIDPHKLSVTIEVVDDHEAVLATGRFGTDRTGYAAMLEHHSAWPNRMRAAEGSNGAGRPLAPRLLADRREELTRQRVQKVNRPQRLLAELTPSKAKNDITTLQAKAILPSVRPRDLAGKTRRRSGPRRRRRRGPVPRPQPVRLLGWHRGAVLRQSSTTPGLFLALVPREPLAACSPDSTSDPKTPLRSPDVAPRVAVVDEFDAGGAGWAMAMSSGALWIQVDPPVDAIVRIDVESGAAVPGGHSVESGPEGLWVVGEDWLARVDPADGNEVLRVDIGGDLALGEGSVWVFNEEGLHRIDPASGKAEDPVARGAADLCSEPAGLIVAFESAWLACKEGKVLRLAIPSGEVTEITTDGGSHTLTATDTAVWVSNYLAGNVSRIDARTNTATTVPGVGAGVGITSEGEMRADVARDPGGLRDPGDHSVGVAAVDRLVRGGPQGQRTGDPVAAAGLEDAVGRGRSTAWSRACRPCPPGAARGGCAWSVRSPRRGPRPPRRPVAR